MTSRMERAEWLSQTFETMSGHGGALESKSFWERIRVVPGFINIPYPRYR